MILKGQISNKKKISTHIFLVQKGNYTEHHLNDDTILAQTDELKDILIAVSGSLDWTLWGWNIKWADRSLDKDEK